jgi:hypothetical protein
LNIGARYEYVEVPQEAEGRIDYGYGDDTNNIQPRVGFAYSPGFEGGFFGRLFGGPGNSSIRAGYGIYHGRIFQSVFSQGGAGVRFNPPDAFFYNQTGVTTALFTPTRLNDPTNGFVFTPGPQATRHQIVIADPGLEMPYTQQWNFSFERQLPFASSMRVSYTGNRGIGLLRFAQGNLPVHDPVNGVLVANHPNNPANLRGQVIRLAADAQCAGTTATTLTTLCPSVVPIGALEYSHRVPRLNERRPDGRYTFILNVSNSSWSYYHGLQAEWKKRLSRGLNFQASYTFSKSIDTTSEATAPGGGDTNQNGNRSRDSRSLSRFHTPHRFTLLATYRLPSVGSGGWLDEKGLKIERLLEGWSVSTVVKLASGTPFTITNSNGFGDLNFDGFTELRPTLLDPSVLGRNIDHTDNSVALLPRSAFGTPDIGDFGASILGRNTFFGDGVQNVDLGIARSFRMPYSEGHRLHFRADLFNAFNHVQYGFPNTDLASTAFGRITGTASQYNPRTIQLSFRYQY